MLQNDSEKHLEAEFRPRSVRSPNVKPRIRQASLYNWAFSLLEQHQIDSYLDNYCLSFLFFFFFSFSFLFSFSLSQTHFSCFSFFSLSYFSVNSFLKFVFDSHLIGKEIRTTVAFLCCLTFFRTKRALWFFCSFFFLFSLNFFFFFFWEFCCCGCSFSFLCREMTKETLKIAVKAANLEDGTSKGS